MITFISFLVVLFGCVNWMSIGMLQYDIVAGFFGTQANIFSRIIYIVIGFAALWFTVSVIRQKGKVNIFKNKIEKQMSYEEGRSRGEYSDERPYSDRLIKESYERRDDKTKH